MQVTFNVKLPAEVKKKGKMYISRCPLLDVYSQGETENQAVKNLAEALQLFILSCFERGVLNKVLTECGFKLARVKTAKPIPSKYKSINVNIPLQAPIKHPAACHA